MRLARRHAGSRLVEQKDLWIARERNAELELLLIAVGQRASDGMRLPGEADRGEQRLGFPATEPIGAGPEVRSLAAMGEEGGPHVFEHREFWKDIGALERAPQSHATDLVRRDASDVASVDEHASRGWS